VRRADGAKLIAPYRPDDFTAMARLYLNYRPQA